MPKIVVPEDRRKAVSEAVVRVVRRAGVEGATLGSVAKEAGLAIGSIRHYFADHEAMMIFTMDQLGHRIGERVAVRVTRLLAADSDRRTLVEDLLAEFLPLDDERRDEAVAWLAFTVAARTRPAFRESADAQHQFLRDLITRILSEAVALGRLPKQLNLTVEAVRLSALLDGLTMQAVLQPESTPPELLRSALRNSLP
ncbi:TetR/AcrR family transcriptional regulator [Amycolatopsis silviterrae]|uniref:TetR/AcrR family transcriptional regulator n=1 Tax=Amycolatopsis silviterrae TaxID=1656914 RepID=A0ABW5HC81_9PSEU